MRLSFVVLLGALIALAGISIILNALFKIDLPILRLALGIFFIYLGVVFILGGSPHPRSDWSDFSAQSRFAPHSVSKQDLKYDVMFGRSVVDLTELEPRDQPRRLEINVVFGEALVKLDPAIPYELEASSVFGAARLPDHRMANFGSLRYLPKDQHKGPLLHIKLNVVFGSAEVVEATGKARRLRASAEPAFHEEAPAAPH